MRKGKEGEVLCGDNVMSGHYLFVGRLCVAFNGKVVYDERVFIVGVAAPLVAFRIF